MAPRAFVPSPTTNTNQSSLLPPTPTRPINHDTLLTNEHFVKQTAFNDELVLTFQRVIDKFQPQSSSLLRFVNVEVEKTKRVKLFAPLPRLIVEEEILGPHLEETQNPTCLSLTVVG